MMEYNFIMNILFIMCTLIIVLGLTTRIFSRKKSLCDLHSGGKMASTSIISETTSTQASFEENKLEVSDSQEQVIQLKALLWAEKEKNAKLKTVIKSIKTNKKAAEMTLANFKIKYENKKRERELISKLRNKLGIMKENAATFSNVQTQVFRRNQL